MPPAGSVVPWRAGWSSAPRAGPNPASRRAHGRNLEGYLRRRSVAERFGWHYFDEELEEIRARLEGLAR